MAETESQGYRFKLEAFEGPLDLLLHLVRAGELAIADIPIVRITEQYLAYLDFMKEIDIDVGSEFILMASTLIYIKTKMLLPQHEKEAEEMREELIERLLQHEQYRAAASALGARAEWESRHWVRPAAVQKPFLEAGEEGEYVEADLFDLISAFQHVLAGIGRDIPMEVSHRLFAVKDKMAELEGLLADWGRISFSELAARFRVRRELITVFLAILELIKERKLRALQISSFGEIVLVRIEEPVAAEE